jgi:hypothetical protein
MIFNCDPRSTPDSVTIEAKGFLLAASAVASPSQIVILQGSNSSFNESSSSEIPLDLTCGHEWVKNDSLENVIAFGLYSP